MKIFFDHKIFTNQNYGGPSRYIVNLVSNLNHFENIEAKIFAPLHINNYLYNDKKKNIVKGIRLPFSDRITNYVKIKKNLLKLNDFINLYNFKMFDPDICHSTYYNKNDLYKPNKLVVTIYDLIHELFRDEYNFKSNFFPKKKILDIATHIICISESTKKDLINIYNIDPNKITVTYLATDFTEDDNNINFKNLIDKKYFLFVGSRWKYKNFSNLIKAISLNSQIKKDYKLILFGGGKLTNYEIDNMKKLQLDDTNVMHLNGDELMLKSLYKHAEFFIYPSKYEGFGIPILESFSQHCPVLCSNTSSLPEVAGDAAFFFNPNDPEQISSAMEKFLSSPLHKKTLIQKGLKQLQMFSWNKCAKETLNVYQNLL